MLHTPRSPALDIESFTPGNRTIARAAAIWRPLAPSQAALAEAGLAFLRGGLRLKPGPEVEARGAIGSPPERYDFTARIGTFGTGNGEFGNRNAIAIDAAGNIYVADHPNHRIQKFAPVSGTSRLGAESGATRRQHRPRRQRRRKREARP